LVRTESLVQCEVLPVVLNWAIEAKAVPDVLEYAQVAFSLVWTVSGVPVVPYGRTPDGAIMMTWGGVVSVDGGGGGGGDGRFEPIPKPARM
jgi:hypothetical protein